MIDLNPARRDNPGFSVRIPNIRTRDFARLASSISINMPGMPNSRISDYIIGYSINEANDV
jgi:hypothetical protein